MTGMRTSTPTSATSTRGLGGTARCWFRIGDFDGALARAQELGAEVLEERHPNPGANHEDVWLRDPDGYVVVLASWPPGVGNGSA